MEVLQLAGTLPLALLSWNFLHTGGHRVRPTWGQTTMSQSTTSYPGVAMAPTRSRNNCTREHSPHQANAPASSTASAPENPSTDAQVKVSLHPITFLEGLRVQGIKGVQALPGVWSLLSTQDKQTLWRGAGGSKGCAPSPTSPDTDCSDSQRRPSHVQSRTQG